jgi:demethylmenaquinone methyltransferase/2-methoxy-6-polyprenyl-1,4-benzoquinol methylase
LKIEYRTTRIMATSEEARPSSGRDLEKQVRGIFSEIAPRYDLLNHVLSLNVDRRWRRKAVDHLEWETAPDGLFLDACAGTYDLSLELAGRRGFRGRVIASDFATPMLARGLTKLRGRAVAPVCGDTLQLPFTDGVFQGAMVAFGVRNLSDIPRGFRELSRVLKPGGRLAVLEFTEPPNPFLRRLYLFYFRRILPVVGRILSSHPWAYEYLPESVRAFPDPSTLAGMMREAGFRDARYELLTFGVAALHVGVR